MKKTQWKKDANNATMVRPQKYYRIIWDFSPNRGYFQYKKVLGNGKPPPQVGERSQIIPKIFGGRTYVRSKH